MSKPELKEGPNLKVLNYKWIKKNWGYRMFFDYFVANKIIKEHKGDLVLSLQNTIIPRTSCNQILYLHQSIPFSDFNFSLFKNKKMWFYQKIIGRKIVQSLKKSEKTIVQTHWMKSACLSKANIPKERIKVIFPKVNIDIKESFEPSSDSMATFFYPANHMDYKNHRLIVSASKVLKEKNQYDYRVLLTLKGDESKEIIELFKEVKELNLPIEFVGHLTKKDVFSLYSKSILIFPSYLETVGLPLIEARMHKSIIFASNCSFSHEILKEYLNAYFFDIDDASSLANYMKQAIKNELRYNDTDLYMDDFYSEQTSILDYILK